MGIKSEDLRVRVAPHLRAKLKAISLETGESEASVIRAAILAYLASKQPMQATTLGFAPELSLVAEDPHEPGKVINPAAAGGAGTAQKTPYPKARRQK